MHVEDEEVERLLHRELDPPLEHRLRSHLTECVQCRARLEEAAREEERIFALLREVDHDPPRIGIEQITARGAASATIPWGRWAAGVVLALAAAGAAYAMPGSPLRAWVSHLVGRVSAPAQPSQAPAPATTSGISVAPGPRFAIVFKARQAEGGLTVALTNEPSIVVRATGGAVGFATDENRLTVDNRGRAASYEIELPRAAPWVEIRVGSRRVLLKQGDSLLSDARPDERGRLHVPLDAGD